MQQIHQEKQRVQEERRQRQQELEQEQERQRQAEREQEQERQRQAEREQEQERERQRQEEQERERQRQREQQALHTDEGRPGRSRARRESPHRRQFSLLDGDLPHIAPSCSYNTRGVKVSELVNRRCGETTEKVERFFRLVYVVRGLSMNAIAQRPLKWRKNEPKAINEKYKMGAAIVQAVGDEVQTKCTSCRNGKEHFKSCVTMTGVAGGGCANCYWRSEHHRCFYCMCPAFLFPID